MKTLVMLALLVLPGCAVLPMNMQPTDPGSRTAEGVWETLDTIDTAQTAQFVRKVHVTETPSGPVTWKCHEGNGAARVLYGSGNPNPARVIATNALLMSAHSYVSAWFDRGVDRSAAADDGNLGLWYVGRIVWHVVSIGASAAAVENNRSDSCL